MAAPIQLVSDHETRHWRRDAHRLEAFEIDGDVLRLTVSYTGGCEAHRFEVLAREITWGRESLEAELSVAHDARGDSCKALIREQIEFSLEPLLSLSRDHLEQPQALSIGLDGRRLYHRLAADVPPPTQGAPPPAY